MPDPRVSTAQSSSRTGSNATTYKDGRQQPSYDDLSRLVGLHQHREVRLLDALERLAEAVRDTLCDDEPCTRCAHLRATLNGMRSLV